MTLIEHLEELRTRLLISLAAFFVGMLVSWFVVDHVLAALIRPVGRVVFLAPTEAFLVRLKVAALAGVFVSLPVVLFQLWRFISVGLTRNERRYTLSLLPVSLLLFVTGALCWVVNDADRPARLAMLLRACRPRAVRDPRRPPHQRR